MVGQTITTSMLLFYSLWKNNINRVTLASAITVHTDPRLLMQYILVHVGTAKMTV